MNELGLSRREMFAYIAISLVISVVAWTVGLGVLPKFVQAAALNNVSDTLSDSDLGVNATHTITWNNATSVTAGQTIRITFDPTTDRFGGVANANTGNVSVTGFNLVASGACTGAASEAQITTSTAAGDESIIFTVCATDTIAASTTYTIVTQNSVLSNPTSTGSYIIRIAGTQDNSADTRIAIIDDVVLTASVDTSFTFTITGVSSTVSLGNGATTTVTSTATTLAFGTLPLTGPVTMAQRLQVATNAKNGYTVTVMEDQNPLSSGGADIDLFANGSGLATPGLWYAPSSTLDQEATYGHLGLTSDDSNLNGGEFGTTSTPLFAGNFWATTTARAVMNHTGPADGTTQNAGLALVGWRIQIGALQEAATLYTNTLTYVATPVF